MKSVLVYKGKDKERMSKYKYIDAPSASITDSLEGENDTLYYRLKQVYEDQDKTYFSDYIVVENKKQKID